MIYGSREAGGRLKVMLELVASDPPLKPFPV